MLSSKLKKKISLVGKSALIAKKVQEIEYDHESCDITSDRLKSLRESSVKNNTALSEEELNALKKVQNDVEQTLSLNKLKEDEGGDRGDVRKPPQDKASGSSFSSLGGGSFLGANLRARLDHSNDGVLGVQADGQTHRRQSSFENVEIFGEEKKEEMDLTYVGYVRKPKLGKITDDYEKLKNHPKYSLKQVLKSRSFHLYKHRFGNAQWDRMLIYPTLPQPPTLCGVCTEPNTEKDRSRPKGHRFIITADTQFGIQMDGFAMENPSWRNEIEISRRCVEQINALEGDERPLFVSVCGDLVDTEGSFNGALASWKKVMTGWERNLVYDQQTRDFKRIWGKLHPDIALVCMCGNHDVGNRPNPESIKRWTDSFGNDYLAFWVNGSFNICLNSCVFSNPDGAQEHFKEQVRWLEEMLVYANTNSATHIFVYGHFPWFLKHEEEADDEVKTFSSAPTGWGPPGSKFPDGYFTVPYKQRKIAMDLFKKYEVTACFSGHFHQNVVAKTSWGMPMIVTGPLSMNLRSEMSEDLSNGEELGLGMRIVDVGEKGEFKHKWTLLDCSDEFYRPMD